MNQGYVEEGILDDNSEICFVISSNRSVCGVQLEAPC